MHADIMSLKETQASFSLLSSVIVVLFCEAAMFIEITLFKTAMQVLILAYAGIDLPGS